MCMCVYICIYIFTTKTFMEMLNYRIVEFSFKVYLHCVVDTAQYFK